MIRLSLISLLLCLLQLGGRAQPFHEPTQLVAESAAEGQAGGTSRPQSVTIGSRPWVRLAGQAEEDGRIILRWQTTSSRPTRSFRVERSTDGVNWNLLGEVDNLPKNAYLFTDEHPLRTGVYRLQCLNVDGSTPYSSVLSVVSPRRANQPVRYFTTYNQAILVGLESASMQFPVTANLYSETGELLCYEQLTKKTDEFWIDASSTNVGAVKLQLIDSVHRVLAVRQILLPH